MPRSRSIADSDLLDGALAVMRRDGPEGLTFQAVAAETGLAAPTLVQRFGSKRKLMQAALLRAWDLLDAETAVADARAGDGPGGAVDLLTALSGGYGEKDAHAEGLLMLREDFRDPKLRKRGAAWGERLAAVVGRRLGGRSGPRPDLGRLMIAQWQGVVIWWGFAPVGRLDRVVRQALTGWCAAVGKPVRAGRGTSARPTKPRGRARA